MTPNITNVNAAKTIALGRISYMNVAPVYYGLDHGLKPEWLEIESHPPTDLNHMLSRKGLDISPVSSVAYARHQDEWLILPDLSISCFGKVMSVLLVSRYPIEQLHGKPIIMTRESATSTELLKLICAMKQVTPIFKTGVVKNAAELPEDTAAALVIGDAALNGQWEHRFEYIVDLGEMWHQLSGLPFVFALWVVRKRVAEQNPERVNDVIELFRQTKRMGRRSMKQIAEHASAKLGLDIDLCRRYYTVLNYDLDSRQTKGVQTFFDGLRHYKRVDRKIELNFFGSDRSTRESRPGPIFSIPPESPLGLAAS